MRVARYTLALQLLTALCTCAALITCTIAASLDTEGANNEVENEVNYKFQPTEPYRSVHHPEDFEDEEESNNVSSGELGSSQLIGSIARKLWHCVEDNDTMTCMKGLFYEEFESKIMQNKNLELLKRYLNKYITDYMKRKKNSPGKFGTKYSGEVNYRQAMTTVTPDDDLYRGMKQKMMDFLPFLLAPALFMAGVMPWLIPPLKMMVMFVGMINQFAFSSALFALVRNYVFNRKQEEHVFYINHGYSDHRHR